MPTDAGLFALAKFTAELEQIMGVEVDVVPEGSVKPRVRANIEKDLVPL